MIDSTVRHRGSLIVRWKRQGATRDRQECHSSPDAGCAYPPLPRKQRVNRRSRAGVPFSGLDQ